MLDSRVQRLSQEVEDLSLAVHELEEAPSYRTGAVLHEGDTEAEAELRGILPEENDRTIEAVMDWRLRNSTVCRDLE